MEREGGEESKYILEQGSNSTEANAGSDHEERRGMREEKTISPARQRPTQGPESPKHKEQPRDIHNRCPKNG